jgi:hypothetical protein
VELWRYEPIISVYARIYFMHAPCQNEKCYMCHADKTFKVRFFFFSFFNLKMQSNSDDHISYDYFLQVYLKWPELNGNSEAVLVVC